MNRFCDIPNCREVFSRQLGIFLMFFNWFLSGTVIFLAYIVELKCFVSNMIKKSHMLFSYYLFCGLMFNEVK